MIADPRGPDIEVSHRMPHIDLNADLAEGAAHDAELLAVVTTVNLACGGHVWQPAAVLDVLRRVAGRAVRVGAHPSYPDRAGFGRRETGLSAAEVDETCRDQIAALRVLIERAAEGICDRPRDVLRPSAPGNTDGPDAGAGGASADRVRLHHLKPHGALYHRAALDPDVADVLARLAAGEGLAVIGGPDSALQDACRRAGVGFLREGFADRRYGPDGRLVPRSQPGAVITDPAEAAAQAVLLARGGGYDTLCLHGDTPDAATMARAVADALRAADVSIGAGGGGVACGTPLSSQQRRGRP